MHLNLSCVSYSRALVVAIGALLGSGFTYWGAAVAAKLYLEGMAPI